MATKIGTRIMERRHQLGLTQEELAFRMGYKTKSAINKIELGINDVSQSKVVKFAEALNTSVAYLMGWDEEQVEKPTNQAAGELSETKQMFDAILQECTDAEAAALLAMSQAFLANLRQGASAHQVEDSQKTR